MNRNGLGALGQDHALASTAATRHAAGGLIGAADVGRRPMPWIAVAGFVVLVVAALVFLAST